MEKLRTRETITQAHRMAKKRSERSSQIVCVCVCICTERLKVYEEQLRYDTGENELRKRNEYKKMNERKSRGRKNESTNRKKC